MMRRPVPFSSTEVVLDNGLRVVVVPTAARGLVSLWTIVRVGSRDEAIEGRSGFAHFFEHMMFRGSERFPAAEYNRRMMLLGADVNAFTDTDLTAYYVTLLPRDLERALELEADRFMHLSYDEQAFRDEAGAVLGEYLKGLSDPWFTLEERLLGTAFRVHPYGHAVIGRRQDIEAMPSLYEASLDFYRRYYRPDNTVLLVSGDVDRTRSLEAVRRHFGVWQPGAAPYDVPAEPEQDAPRRVSTRFSGRSLPLLWIGCRMPAFGEHEDVAGALVLAEAGFGSTSPLYRRLVLDERRAITLSAHADLARDPRLFHVHASVRRPADVDAVVEAIERTFDALAEDVIDDERLAGTRSHMLAGLRLRLDTPTRFGMTLAPLLALAGGLEPVNDFWEQALRLPAERVRQAARRIFDPARRTVALLEGES